MPELPDVEVFRRYLDATSLRQKIELVEVKSEKILGGVCARKLRNALKGASFESTRRHGKYLFARLDAGGWLMLHFGMTGNLKYFKNAEDEPRHSRLLLGFEGGYRLSFDCQRMLGKVDLVETPEDLIGAKRLGPDALGIDLSTFRERLKGKRGTVKSVLMDQRAMAGIGNVYSDEMLFQARVHPGTNADGLDEKTIEKLYRKTGQVLRTAIDRRANPEKLPDCYLLPHRREGGKCPRCGDEVKRAAIAGRSAYYCPACQPEGKSGRRQA